MITESFLSKNFDLEHSILASILMKAEQNGCHCILIKMRFGTLSFYTDDYKIFDYIKKKYNKYINIKEYIEDINLFGTISINKDVDEDEFKNFCSLFRLKGYIK